MGEGQNVEYDEDAFRGAAAKTGAVRDKIQGVVDTLQTSIASRGAPWGTDSLGDTFANGQNGNPGYTTARDNLIEGAENVAGTFDSFHDGQVESADLLRDMEDGNRDGLR
ncbi:hypothetical protein ACFWPH_24405 [Nocardia sp. NPDC058499]|uniref:hypothetical protein n=1 Tax=Nocardia sp. NPDC058499 TaxID=3346530 RepID=UPI003648B75A